MPDLILVTTAIITSVSILVGVIYTLFREKREFRAIELEYLKDDEEFRNNPLLKGIDLDKIFEDMIV